MDERFADPTFPILVIPCTEGFVRLDGTPHLELLFARDAVVRRDRGNDERRNLVVTVPSGRTSRVYVGPDPGSCRLILGAALVEHLDLSCSETPVLGALHRPDVTLYHLSERAGTEIVSTLARMSRELNERTQGYHTLITAGLLTVFVSLYRSSLPAHDLGVRHSGIWRMGDVIDHIREHYADEFSLMEMAARCGLNQNYFSRAFKEATGVPPFEYINRVRVEKACLRLKKSDDPVLEIAFAVGYNNVSFFNRYFRRIMGLSPREYRKKVRR